MNDIRGKNTRNTTIDALRIILSFFVIYHHAMANIFLSCSSSEYAVNSVLFIFTNCTVPIFLMISGMLLLTKNEDMNKSINRVIKYTFVLILYSFVSYFIIRSNSQISLSENIYRCFILIVQSYVVGSYWYLYLYIYILLLLPIFRKIISIISFADYIYICIIYFFVSLMPISVLIIRNINVSNTTLSSMVPSYGIYLLYFVAGFYLYKYKDILNNYIWVYWVTILLITVLVIVFSFAKKDVSQETFNYT